MFRLIASFVILTFSTSIQAKHFDPSNIKDPTAVKILKNSIDVSIYQTPSNIARDGLGDFSTWRLPYLDDRSVRQVMIDGVPMFEFTLKQDDPMKSGSKRAELTTPENIDIQTGETGEYQLGFMVPVKQGRALKSVRRNPDRTAVVLAQWKGHNGKSPALAIRLKNNGNLCITVNHDGGREYLYDEPIDFGVIYKFHLVVRWSPGKDGFVHVNMNGKSIATHRGPIGYHDKSLFAKDGLYFKFGIYNPNNYPIQSPEGIKVYHLAYWYRH